MALNERLNSHKPYILFVPLFTLTSALLLYGVIQESLYQRVIFNYLLAFVFLMSLALSGLFFTMIQHAVNAGWSPMIRRIPENMTHLFPLGFLLIIPIFLNLDTLYYWHAQLSNPHVHDPALLHKAAYLNTTFYITRSVIYFLLWILLYERIVRQSFLQDIVGSTEITRRITQWSYVGLVIFAATITFAAIDWIMSLKAHWFSTIYGVYYFAGAFVGGLATTIVALLTLKKFGYMKDVTHEHFHDLGKLLYAFNVFWAYIAFSQFMLIWYSNIPEETVFFADRGSPSWHALSLFLVIGHFVVPFFLLMSRHTKRNLKVLFMGALWLLAMHYVDLFWLIMPNFSKESVNFGWIEVTTIFWAISLLGLVLTWSFNRYALVPLKDPRIQESLEFHQL